MRALILGLVLLAPGVALAQDPAVPAHAQVLPEQIITASPPRPHAMYFLPRAHVRFDTADRTSHRTVDRIVESVRHEPF